MKRKEFPQVGESYVEHTLPNGLVIRVVEKPEFAKLHALVAVNYGSVDTTFALNGQAYRTPDGVTHYLEHKMFDMPQGDAALAFSAQGASCNAGTSYDKTVYYFEATENFEENIALLVNMVFTPWFTQESVEKERGIIAQEIKMYEDSADARVFELLFAALFSHHPLRVPIAGSVASIEDITAQTLDLCHKAYYRPDNAILCVAGNIDPQHVIALAQENIPSGKLSKAVTDYGPDDPVCCATHQVQEEMDVSMPTFVLGVRCDDQRPKDAVSPLAGDIAVELLAGESSALYQRLYDQGLINADFSCGQDVIRGKAVLFFGGESRDPAAVREAILTQARQMCREEFPQEDFQRLKKSDLGRRLRDLDDFHDICSHIASDYFDGIEYFAFPQAYEAVTPEAVQKVLACIVPERSVLSVIVPRKEGGAL